MGWGLISIYTVFETFKRVDVGVNGPSSVNEPNMAFPLSLPAPLILSNFVSR